MKFLKRLIILLLVLVIVIGGAYLLRRPLLRTVGNYLIAVDTEVHVDAAFILSGNPLERSLKAKDILKKGYTPLLITTGKGINPSLESIDIRISDAKLGRDALIKMGVDSASIRILEAGTSTLEESEAILGYAENLSYKRVMIITSMLHTRRVKRVFRKKFAKAGIDVYVVGASPLTYEVKKWWESEPGMIFVNNEYMKLLYYAWKY